MKIELLHGDITEALVDAVVNAANSSLLGGGGVDGAIHRKGGPAILEACIQIRNRQGGCSTGEAVITTAGELPATFVIHTVGPVWNNDTAGERALLYNCYYNSLRLADEHHVERIAFPNISTGVYRFPKKLAAQIAYEAVLEYFDTCDSGIEQVQFVCYDEENYLIYKRLLEEKGRI